MPAEASITTVAARLVESGLPLLPVVKDGRCVGTVDESCLLASFEAGAEPDEAIEPYVQGLMQSVRPYTLGAECLRVFEATRAAGLVVVDDSGWPVGVVTLSRLIEHQEEDNRPKTLGGMATPFGVYLTDGTVRGGVSQWALVATGALMFGLLTVGMFVAKGIELTLPPSIVKSGWFEMAENVFALVVFALGLRLTGLTGIHGSEHKVVNAIEQGEPVSAAAVQRMSRIHPRCGTNIAVGASLFFALLALPWASDMELRGLLAGFVTFFTWRPLGALAQRFVTTTEPNDRQLALGVAAGESLLKNYREARSHRPTILTGMWNSGLLHIVSGSLLVHLLVWGVVTVLRLPAPWRDIIGL